MKKTLTLLFVLPMLFFVGCPEIDQDEQDDDVQDFEISEDQMLDFVGGGWAVVTDSGSSGASDMGDSGDSGVDFSNPDDIDWDEYSPEELEQMVEDYRNEVLDGEDADQYAPDDVPEEEAANDDDDEDSEADDSKPEKTQPEQVQEEDDDVVWEGYFFGNVDANPSSEHDVYLSSIKARIEGPIYVHGDYSVTGNVRVIYETHGQCATITTSSSCSLQYTTDGVYKVTGSVVKYQEVEWANKDSEWPFPEDYWIQVFFTRQTPATETMLFMAPYYTAVVTDNGLESVLYGPFAFPQLFFPGVVSHSFYDGLDFVSYKVNNAWGSGEVFIQLFDKENGDDFKFVRDFFSS